MTLLYTQGFEAYDATATRTVLDKDFNYNEDVLATEAGLTTGRNGLGVAAFHARSGGISTTAAGHIIPCAGLSSEDDWVVGFAFRSVFGWFDVSGTERSPILEFIDSDGVIMLSVYLASGTLNVRNGNPATGTKLGFADALLTTNVWHYFECKVNFNAAGSVTLHLNEEPVLTLSTVQTIVTGGDTRPSSIAIGGGIRGQRIEVDDIYILDDAGSIPAHTDFLGDVRIERLNPTGIGATDGSGTEFTPLAGTNWASVADAGTTGITDDDTSYVESSTLSDKDTYAFGAALSVTPANIEAVSIKTSVRKTDAGSRNFVHVAKQTTELDSAILYPSVTYRYMESIFPQDPVAGTPATWTASNLATAEFGYKVNA